MFPVLSSRVKQFATSVCHTVACHHIYVLPSPMSKINNSTYDRINQIKISSIVSDSLQRQCNLFKSVVIIPTNLPFDLEFTPFFIFLILEKNNVNIFFYLTQYPFILCLLVLQIDINNKFNYFNYL